MKKRRDPGRGQLHSRGARVWRDENNPSGPMREQGEEEEEPSPSDAPDQPDQPDVASPSNSGAGGGGATESAGRAKHQEGLHGGPTRNT